MGLVINVDGKVFHEQHDMKRSVFNVGFNEGNDEAIRMTTRPIVGRESEKISSFETEMNVDRNECENLEITGRQSTFSNILGPLV